MDTIFLNSENSKTSESDRLLLNLSSILYQTLAFTIHGKISKSHTKIINLKYQLRHGIKSLNYLMDHILCQVFKITLNIS